MSWNKTSIASTASLNQIAQTFSLKRNVAGSHHLRAKTDSEGHTVIYQKHFSTTKFLAILGSADAKATIRKQRQLANHLLSEKVGNEYGSGTVDHIQLRGHAPLRGYQVEAMQAHAAVAAAVDQMELPQRNADKDFIDRVCEMARDHVYQLPPEASAGRRIYEAKLFIIRTIVEDGLSFHFRHQPETLKKKLSELNSLCTSLQYSPFAQSLDLTVVAGLSSLLKSDENPVIHQLETHIANARQGHGARS
ncbi:hypothetical protein ACWKW4_21230 [Hydrogenophaga borbori]|uniref:hypothetical protein n=1 Tax=Hydrogenophaga borbori TaxID=2294117 RepID=UPI00301BCFC3